MDMSFLAHSYFVQAGFIWCNVFALGLCAAFYLGMRRGFMTADRFHRVWTILFFVGMVSLGAYGYFSGQMTELIDNLGVGTFFELLVFGFGWFFFMWFLTKTYLLNRKRNEVEGLLDINGKRGEKAQSTHDKQES